MLLSNIEVAKELGAEVVRLHGTDPVETLLQFAAAHGVSDIVIGRGQESLLSRLLSRSFTARMVDRAGGFDLHIVSFEEARTTTDEGTREQE